MSVNVMKLEHQVMNYDLSWLAHGSDIKVVVVCREMSVMHMPRSMRHGGVQILK